MIPIVKRGNFVEGSQSQWGILYALLIPLGAVLSVIYISNTCLKRAQLLGARLGAKAIDWLLGVNARDERAQ
jgi:hypothetical protein